jgi:two-component system chemotaxis response regulator CheB
MAPRKLRVLVVDDSAVNRRSLTDILNRDPEIEVIGSAADGEEGLKAALASRPDAVTLDLHMPRVDGFTFLRLLMAKRPTPVVVISSYARKNDAFQALELGAVDFVARPGRPLIAADAAAYELVSKIKALRNLGSQALGRRTPMPTRAPPPARETGLKRLALIGASTGGPPAITQLLERLPADLPLAVVVAQHMPPQFTKAFAERVNRSSSFEVAEATDGEVLAHGRALIAPGGQDLLVQRLGGGLRVHLVPPQASRKYHPSVDALFTSAAAVVPTAVGVVAAVLTGMGNDGQEGVVALKKAGALTLAESQRTSVIFGMPREAIKTGAVDKTLDLPDLVEALVRFGWDGVRGPSSPKDVW